MIIGIDLGTTFSAIAYIDENGTAQIISNREGERTTPSVVLFEGTDICIGSQAKQSSIVEPLNVCQFVKRQIGNPKYYFEDENGEKYSAEDISALILKRLKDDAECFLGKRVDGAVITVPAYFSDAQRKATQDAGAIAGLNVLAVINEPTAAALAFCNQKPNETGIIMVFDLGGGTFDVTLMRLNGLKNIDIIATGGHKNLGGFDFDNALINYLVAEFEKEFGLDLYDDDNTMQDLREKCEAAKKTLSNREKAIVAINYQGNSFKREITRELFTSLINSTLNNAKTIMEIVLDDAKIKWSDVNKILLVGGSTRIPAIKDMLTEISGISPSSEINPDEAVAIGAAYYGALITDSGDIVETKITDVNSHSLGILTASDKEGEMINSIILPRNTPLPAECSEKFTTLTDYQKGIELQVTEGEDDDPDYVTIVGTANIVLKPRPAGSPIEVVMQYDKNGIIHICVRDMVDGNDLGEMVISRTSNLSDDDVQTKINRISKIDVS